MVFALTHSVYEQTNKTMQPILKLNTFKELRGDTLRLNAWR